jgi:heparan-alpha-glucosaminide N-acetyltransferase
MQVVSSTVGSHPKPIQIVKAAPRNVAMDAYRGFVMLLMMAEVVRLSRVARAVPESWFWNAVAWQQTHVEWAGCSLHDLIQPSFSFLVGVALPYSIASRVAKGGTFGRMLGHAVWRSFLLAGLGIFLRSMSSSQTNFTFEDTLTQIGLGYTFLFLLGFRSERVQWIALGSILFGYWLAWALYPVSSGPADFAGNFTGFLAHWNKNANLGQAFDVWFLNLLPRAKPFVFNGGGYLTLSFIPTLGTMILGLIAGKWMRDGGAEVPVRKFVVAGAAGIALGLALHFGGVCPIVKRIWTPAWTIFSGGACFLLLAGFSWLTEVREWKKWAFPLQVIGMNSIAAYLIAHLFEKFIESSLRIHLGQDFFKLFGAAYEPSFLGSMVLACYWLILWWMHERRLYLRI